MSHLLLLNSIYNIIMNYAMQYRGGYNLISPVSASIGLKPAYIALEYDFG